MIVADQQQSEGKMPMFTRIGIHTGVALIGNIGFEARLNYTAMGDMVNLGSRLEGLNKYYGTQILISEETYRSAREAIEARFIDLVAVKGKSIAVRVYELVCARGDLPPAQATLIAAYERAMELYLGREFAAAAEAFSKLAESHPKDEPTLVMLNRCRAFVSQPPAPEWKGEFVMESK